MIIKELEKLYTLHEKLNKHEYELICQCGKASRRLLQTITMKDVFEWQPNIPLSQKVMHIIAINNCYEDIYSVDLLYKYALHDKNNVIKAAEEIKPLLKKMEPFFEINSHIYPEQAMTIKALLGIPAKETYINKPNLKNLDVLKLYHFLGDKESCKYLVNKYPARALSSPYCIYYLSEGRIKEIIKHNKEIKNIDKTIQEEHLKSFGLALNLKSFPAERLKEFSPIAIEFIKFLINPVKYVVNEINKLEAMNHIEEHINQKFKDFIPKNCSILIEKIKKEELNRYSNQVIINKEVYSINVKIKINKEIKSIRILEVEI